MKLFVRPRFYSDLEESVAYLSETAGPEIARRWASAVWHTADELNQHPFFGRERRDPPFPGVRSWRVMDFTRWLVFYGLKPKGIVFYRVKHGAVNLVKLDFNS